MKVSTLVFIFVLIETSVWGGAVDSDFQRAHLNGAKARIELTVHDECGAHKPASHLPVERDKGDGGVVDAADGAFGLCGGGGVEGHECGGNRRNQTQDAPARETVYASDLHGPDAF